VERQNKRGAERRRKKATDPRGDGLLPGENEVGERDESGVTTSLRGHNLAGRVRLRQSEEPVDERKARHKNKKFERERK